MKPSRISIALLVVSLLFAPALFAQAPTSESQGVTALIPAASAADVPRLIKFSGTLLDEQGHALGGPVGVTFAFYAQQTGGAALWLETQNVKPDANGNYVVLLGANSAKGVPMELFASGAARWLGVQVEQRPEHERVLLVSVPYALKAADAETLGGKPPSAYALSGRAGSLANDALVSQTIVAPVTMPTAPSADSPAAAAATSPITAASACAAITADGTALVNQLAKFSGLCQIHQSLLSDNGTTVSVAGAFNHPAVAAATSTLGKNSFSANFTASAFNSSTHLPVNQNFRWQAEPVGNNTSSPSGKLNLLFASGTGTPAETGLSISNKGVFTFAPGQAFSGNGAALTNVNAVQLGGVAATGYAKLAAANTFTQPLSIKTGATGNLLSVQGTGTGKGSFTVDASGNITNSGVIVAGNDINTSGFLFSNGLDSTGLASLHNGLSVTGSTSFSGAIIGTTIFNGAVGIGTTTPAAQMEVAAGPNTGLDGVRVSGANGGPTFLAGAGILSFGGTTSEFSRNGGTGVFTVGGDAKGGGFGSGGVGISAGGGRNTDGTKALAGDFTGDVDVSGCLRVAQGTPSFVQFGSCPSDVKLKKNIEPFPAVLDKVVRLQPVTYNWRTEEFPQRRFPSDRATGLIAQEVEKVFPKMVSSDEAGYKRVNYGELPYLMLQAIRELKAENDNLRERIQRLEEAAVPTP